MKLNLLLILTALWAAACAPLSGSTSEPGALPPDTAVTSPPVGAPTEEQAGSPYDPQPGDENLTQGEVFIEDMGLIIRESFPPQIALEMSGNLPTPCNQLRVEVEEPDDQNQIDVSVYSVVDPEMVCAQVLESFQVSIDLGTYPSGHYSVLVNGELAGEFDS
jgi:hypothetical protein